MITPEITAEPRIKFNIDRSTILALMKLADNHYDGTCKASAKQGGFLYGWSLRATNVGNPNLTEVVSTFREIDITLKICELLDISKPEEILSSRLYQLAVSYRTTAHIALQIFNANVDVIKSWKIEIH